MQSTWTCNWSWLRAHSEIDRQSNGIAWQRPVKPLLDQGLGAPGDREHGRRVGREHLRIFDASDAPCRNGEHLRDADQILQNCDPLLDAAVEVDVLARLRTQTRFDVRHAFAMHDSPQSVRIGASRRVDLKQPSPEDETQDSGFSPNPSSAQH
jgi:hypothetical protein